MFFFPISKVHQRKEVAMFKWKALAILVIFTIVCGCASTKPLGQTTASLVPNIETKNMFLINSKSLDSDNSGITSEKALKNLSTQIDDWKKMVDADAAGKTANKLKIDQYKWDDATFYSMIIVGAVGTIATGVFPSAGSATLVGLLTIGGGVVDKAAHNNNRLERIEACVNVNKSGLLKLDAFKRKWEIDFERPVGTEQLPKSLMDKYKKDSEEISKEIEGLLNTCIIEK